MISLLAPFVLAFLLFHKTSTVKEPPSLPILLGLVFLLLALGYDLGPSTKALPADGGGDILFCLDVSRSMLARDLSPDRLTRAKQEIKAIIKKNPQDRFGLVVFAGKARLLVPLTRDKASFQDLLKTANPLLVDQGGTDFGKALTLALDALVPSEPKRSPSIVLLSDGEDHGDKGSKLAKHCKDRRIPVFCLGIGTRWGSKIPILMENGKEVFLKNNKGQEVLTRLHPQGLKRIAIKSAGKYFEKGEGEKKISSFCTAAILGARKRDRGSPLLGQFLALLGFLFFSVFLAKSPGGKA
jgi:Ca-activated chloride channel family protein